MIDAELQWHRGPALGGEGTAGPKQWWDGETLLVGVNEGDGLRFTIGTVMVDGGKASLLDTNGDVWGRDLDRIGWWAKLDDNNLPTDAWA